MIDRYMCTVQVGFRSEERAILVLRKHCRVHPPVDLMHVYFVSFATSASEQGAAQFLSPAQCLWIFVMVSLDNPGLPGSII